MNKGGTVEVAALTWMEIERRLTDGAVAVVPVGAAAKAHGPHLPMGTDCLQAEWLARRLAERISVLVWPTLSYGYYPAFVDYPGSCSLSRSTFLALASEVLRDILRAGAQKVLVVNTGLSTVAPLEEAVGRVSASGYVRLAHVYRGRRYRDLVARLKQQRYGSHADEIETSLMLVIAANAVNMDKAQVWDRRCFEHGPFSRTDPDSPNYTPSGVYGDPTLATVQKGERLLEAMLADLFAMASEWESVPPGP